MEMIRGRATSNGVDQVPNLSANNLLQTFFITTNNHFCNREGEDSMHGENREMTKKRVKEEVAEEEEEKDVELSLGLSLNGQFGTDPRSRKRKNFELGRSSSIPEGFIFDQQRSVGGNIQGTVGSGVSDMLQLDRTRSLPVQTEIEKRSEKTKTFMELLVAPKNRGQGTETEKASGEKDGFVLADSVTTKRKRNVEVSGMEKARNILEDMPRVQTRDVGANGKKVEGFLYWCGDNKEEMKILCVCHGSFLSPAEFVKHGGATVKKEESGGDVGLNPLRDIVVKFPSASF